MKTLIQDHFREERFIIDKVEHCAVVDDIFCEDALFPGMFGKERKDKEWENMVRLRSALLQLGESKQRLIKKKRAWLVEWNASPLKKCLLEWIRMENELLAHIEQTLQKAEMISLLNET